MVANDVEAKREHLRKRHGGFEVIAECIHRANTRIVILDEREAPALHAFRLGMICERETMLDRIVRKLVRKGRAEKVC